MLVLGYCLAPELARTPIWEDMTYFDQYTIRVNGLAFTDAV